jgi:peroxiredoxin
MLFSRRTAGLCLTLSLVGTGIGVISMMVSADSAMAQPAQAGGRPWFGVEVAARKDSRAGVLAKHVIRTSPADVAGLRDGDGILKVGGKVVSSPEELISEIRSKRPGEGLEIGFERGGTARTAHVRLGIFPAADEMLRRDRVGTFAKPLSGVQAVQGVVGESVSALKGKVVVLDFWAAWCSVCRLTTPVLNDVHARYAAQGLVMIGLSSDTAPVATRAMGEFGIKYPVAVDKAEKVFSAYGVSSLPTMYVIDKRGVVREVEVGFDAGSARRLDALVQKLLAEKAD